MKRVTFEELKAFYEQSLVGDELADKMRLAFIERLEEMWADLEVTALVRFENHDFCSSSFGDSTVMKIGPHCTYTAVEQVAERHLYDLPSQRQYPTVYCQKDAPQ